MRVFLAVMVMASPALADVEHAELMDFMGGQGCTFGAQSRAAAQAAGIEATRFDAAAARALADGTATQQGDWVVLDASVCTIRLPEIASAFSVATPEIAASFPYTRSVYEFDGDVEVDEGCFATNLREVLDSLAGGDADAGYDAYIRFAGAGMIAGDLRFFSDSPLSTPVGVQRVSGGCARAPGVAEMARSYAILLEDFGTYVRRLGEGTSCGEDGSAWISPQIIAAELQGVDVAAPEQVDPEVNAWLWFEWDIIAMAAGWHAGQSATERGTPRPPLCHFAE